MVTLIIRNVHCELRSLKWLTMKSDMIWTLLTISQVIYSTTKMLLISQVILNSQAKTTWTDGLDIFNQKMHCRFRVISSGPVLSELYGFKLSKNLVWAFAILPHRCNKKKFSVWEILRNLKKTSQFWTELHEGKRSKQARARTQA